MPDLLEKLEHEALSLSRQERAFLAERLEGILALVVEHDINNYLVSRP